MAEERERRRPRGGPRRPRRKACSFCIDKVDHIEYKDAFKLRKYITDAGKILPRRISGCCAKHQEKAHHGHKEGKSYRIVALYNGI